MPRNTYSEEEKQEALRIFGEQGIKAATDATGYPANTIKYWAKAAGVPSGRTANTAAANQARRETAAAARTLIETDSLALAEKLLTELTRRIDRTPELIADRDLTTMFGVTVDKALALARLNDDHGAANATSMLERLAAQINVADD